MSKEVKLFYSRDEMLQLNKQKLLERGVNVEDIAKIAYNQQARYNPNVDYEECVKSVEKILSLRDIFHLLQLGVEIDRLTEEGMFKGPIQDIMRADLGVLILRDYMGQLVKQTLGILMLINKVL